VLRRPPTAPLFPYTTLFRSFGRLQLGSHVEDAYDVLPRVVVVPDGGGQRAAVAATVPAEELACGGDGVGRAVHVGLAVTVAVGRSEEQRLNSSHLVISYAVF